MEQTIIVENYIRHILFSTKKGVKAKYYEFDFDKDIFTPDLPKRKLSDHPFNFITKQGRIDRFERIDYPGRAGKSHLDKRLGLAWILAGKYVPSEKIGNYKKYDKAKICLVYRDTKEPVLANPSKAGKVKKVVLNGQMILSGNLNKFAKNTAFEQIEEQFTNAIDHQNIKPVKEYPITITIDLYDKIKDPISNNQDWDVGNRLLPFVKVYPDVLTRLGIIEDDNCQLVQNAIGGNFYPIDDDEIPKLVVTLKHI